jgi:hypothetical protein
MIARGEAGRPIESFIAEKALRTRGGVTQRAGATAPALAEQSLLAPCFGCGGQELTFFTLLSESHQRAEANQGVLVVRQLCAAGKAHGTLLIGHAGAGGTVTLPTSHIEEAAQRWITILVVPAAVLVGQQTLSFLEREHWERLKAWGSWLCHAKYIREE